MEASLYERLGGSEGIIQLASDLVDKHMSNARIKSRFAESDVAKMKNGAATFFITATGGPQVYEGKDMLATHKGMNIDAAEFMAVLDDALEALDQNNIAPREQADVIFALLSMRKEVMLV